MESKRLIPYSVYLREDIYLKLKEFAQGRKAACHGIVTGKQIGRAHV